MADCFKAEAVVFALDAISVLALLAGLAAFVLHPLAGPIASLGMIVVLLFLGNRVADTLSGTHLELPAAFWWRWQTVGIVVVEMLGWLVGRDIDPHIPVANHTPRPPPRPVMA